MLGGDNLWITYFTVYCLLTTAVTTITKSYNISFVNQAVTVNENVTVKYILFKNMLLLGGLLPFIVFHPK
jgi:hypothetical protein